MSPAPLPPAASPQLWDRVLDGEGSPAEVAAIEAACRADPRLAAAFGERRAYLAWMARAGAAWRQQTKAAVSPALLARVRLSTRNSSRRALFLAPAAAAAVVAALGAWMFLGGRQAEGVPAGVLKAVDLARALASPEDNPEGCGTGLLAPATSRLVREGGFSIVDCKHEGAMQSAQLMRTEDLEVVGWVAMPAPGRSAGPEIGITVIDQHVVFDVAAPGRYEYLAVDKYAYATLHRALGERASCFVCHRYSRDGDENPHRIVQRSWVPQDR